MAFRGETGMKIGERFGLGNAAVHRGLLICGIVSSLFYIVAIVWAGSVWEGYSYIDQAVSELMAIGAPSRPLLTPLFTIYTVLVVAFGLGVWRSGYGQRLLQTTGVMLVAYGIAGYVTGVFFPMPLRETIIAGEAGGIEHIVGSMVMGLFCMLAQGVGAMAFGLRFRIYSFATILAIILLAAWSGVISSQMVVGTTPWLGLVERIDIMLILQWVVVLAVKLLRAEKSYGPLQGRGA